MPSASTPKPSMSNRMPLFASVFGRNSTIPVVARMPNGRLT